MRNRRVARTLVGRRVGIRPALNPFEELLETPLLKQTHQRAPKSFRLVARDFGDPSVAKDIGAGNLLELEIPGDVGVDEDAGELAVGHHELGNEVDGVVAVAAQFARRFLALAELAVELGAKADVLCQWGHALDCSPRT
jgi:hypothetical protein